jgi:hypothetical protein
LKRGGQGPGGAGYRMVFGFRFLVFCENEFYSFLAVAESWKLMADSSIMHMAVEIINLGKAG